MDWKEKLDRLLWGKPPEIVAEYKTRIGMYKYFIFILLFSMALIFFGTQVQEQEINSCWSELEVYRLDNVSSVIGGFQSSTCDVVDGFVYCDIDNFTMLGEE